jgi:hypothetical protein
VFIWKIVANLFWSSLIELFLEDLISLFKEPEIELLEVFFLEDFAFSYVESRFCGEDLKRFIDRSLMK